VPLIADVHTEPNLGSILHVGTGQPRWMVMTADAYVGLVSSFRVHVDKARLSDNEWQNKLSNNKNLGVPAWAQE